MANSYLIIGPNTFPRVEGADTGLILLQIWGEPLLGQSPGMELEREADDALAMATELIRHAKAVQKRRLFGVADKIVTGLPEKQPPKALDRPERAG